MSSDWYAPGALIGALTAIGTIIGMLFTRRSSTDTLLLASRDDHIDDLREDLRDTRDRLDRLAETVEVQGKQIHRLQVREWSLRRYVTVLIDKIRALGHEPPDPPADLNL